MLVQDFFLMLLDDTLEEARHGSLHRHDAMEMAGTERAVEECRVALTSHRIKHELALLLTMAQQDYKNSDEQPDTWFWFNRLCTVEWIAETVSVVLMMYDQPLVVIPGTTAMLTVARIASGMPSA